MKIQLTYQLKVLSSTPKPVVVFEGEKPTDAKDSVTPGEGGKSENQQHYQIQLEELDLQI